MKARCVDDRIVDACAMQLVLKPWQFDMILTTNLFGDILSDEIAGLVGVLGLAPGCNIGLDAAIFEAVHGSAKWRLDARVFDLAYRITRRAAA